MYHRGWVPAPAPMPENRCAHPECTHAATHERAGFPFCLRHFMLVLQWEQGRVDHEGVL